MNEYEIKERIEGLIKEMIEDGATWADERWGILGDLFEDAGSSYAEYCRYHDPATKHPILCTPFELFENSALVDSWRKGVLWGKARMV